MANITFTTDEKTVAVAVGEMLIDVANKENLSIPFGCQNGICGTCLSTVKKGVEHLSKKSDKEKQTLEMFDANDKQRLVCQCKVVSEGDVEIEN